MPNTAKSNKYASVVWERVLDHADCFQDKVLLLVYYCCQPAYSVIHYSNWYQHRRVKR